MYGLLTTESNVGNLFAHALAFGSADSFTQAPLTFPVCQLLRTSTSRDLQEIEGPQFLHQIAEFAISSCGSLANSQHNRFISSLIRSIEVSKTGLIFRRQTHAQKYKAN